MSSTQFVQMYHPLIPSTATSPALVAVQAVDERYAKGWLLVDPDALPPVPDTPYYTKEALLSQISAGAAPIGTALRAASVAAVQDAITAGDIDVGEDFRSLLGARFAWFGDSITNFDQRFPFYASILAEQRINFDPDLVFSYSGFSSGQLVAETADVLAATPAPHAVFVHAGANDGQGLVTLATFKANMTTIITTFRDAGIPVVVGGVLPLGQTNARPLVRQYNQWLRLYCAAEGLTFVDFYPAMVDRATGAPLATMLSGDGVHPTPLGLKTMAALIVDAVGPVLPVVAPLLAADATDATNMQVGGLALVDTNADGVPDGWSATGTATGWTSSLVDDEFATGKWMRLVGSGGTTQRTYESTPITSGFSVGDELLATCRVRTSGLTETDSALWVQALFYNASFAIVGNGYLISGLTAPVDGVASVRMTVPATADRFAFYFQAGPGDGTYEVADVTVVNLTALGIA